MNTEQSLKLLKNNLNIMHEHEDEYLKAILDSIEKEFNVEGASLDYSNIDELMLIVDYAAYRYRERYKLEIDTPENTGMPRHIRWRLNNKIIKKAATDNE